MKAIAYIMPVSNIAFMESAALLPYYLQQEYIFRNADGFMAFSRY